MLRLKLIADALIRDPTVRATPVEFTGAWRRFHFAAAGLFPRCVRFGL